MMAAHVRLPRMSLSTRSLGAALLLAAGASAACAQRRELASDHPQARLMGYYAAVMQFSPTGLPGALARWEVGAELTYIPSLSAEERRVGFGGTKEEDTNFCPVFPRLRASRAFGAFVVEAGWVPPVRSCGVRAHMFAGAVSRRLILAERWGAGLRAVAHGGTLNAAITCGRDAVADPLDLTCFGGHPSSDNVRPLAFGLDGFLTYGGPRSRRFEPYLLVGVRHERVRFDVNYVRDDLGGLPDLNDHERLQTTLTRIHTAVGASWGPAEKIRLGGELFYAPGALITFRGRAAFAFGRTS